MMGQICGRAPLFGVFHQGERKRGVTAIMDRRARDHESAAAMTEDRVYKDRPRRKRVGVRDASCGHAPWPIKIGVGSEFRCGGANRYVAPRHAYGASPTFVHSDQAVC